MRPTISHRRGGWRVATALFAGIALTIPFAAIADAPNTEWPTYGNDAGGSRYAQPTQVDRE